MATKRELVVNDLARYEKASSRLVLEEYSSCEVPAGCGGAILRWIDPHEALPMMLYVWATGGVEPTFDGGPVESARIDVRPGAHVLALRITPSEGRPPQLALALRYSDLRPSYPEEPRRSRSIGGPLGLLSGVSASLVATSTEPPDDGWRQGGFDAGGWRAMETTTAQALERDRWRLGQVDKTGARVVGLTGASGPLWVRCEFALGEVAP